MLELCSPLDSTPVLFGLKKLQISFVLISAFVIYYFELSQSCYLLLEIHSLIYLNLSSFGSFYTLLEDGSEQFHLLIYYNILIWWVMYNNY